MIRPQTYYIEQDLHDRIKSIAKNRRTQISGLVAELLEYVVSEYEMREIAHASTYQMRPLTDDEISRFDALYERRNQLVFDFAKEVE